MYDTEYDAESTTKAVARDPGGSSTKETLPVPPGDGSALPPEREPGSDATVHKAPAAAPTGSDGAETTLIPQSASEAGVFDHIQDPPSSEAVSGLLPHVGVGTTPEDVDPIGIPDLEESAARRMPVPDPPPPETGDAGGIPIDLPDPPAAMGLLDDAVADPSRTSIDDLDDVGRFIAETDRLGDSDRFDDDLAES